MEWSRYNYIFCKKGNHYLYNFNTNVLLKLDQDNLNKLLKVKEDTNLLKTIKQKRQLIKCKIFLNNENKEIDNYIKEVKKNRQSNNIFDIFIYPTLACNLNCSYCFQSTYDRDTMTKETINNTIDFITSKVSEKGKKFVRVTWMGGEPLLTFNIIKTIIKNINKNINNMDFRHSIVTNGVLLDNNIISELDKFMIYDIQLTIDGLFNDHDLRRPAKNGVQTFDRIIENIKQTLIFSKKFRIIIRINIDNNNKTQFAKIHKFLFDKFHDYWDQIIIYPGFITEYSLTCKSISDDCSYNLSNKEKANFVLDLYNNNEIKVTDFLPKKNLHSCMARTKNSFAIGPKGYIYKCATTVGERDFAIGNVNDSKYFTQTKVLNEFLYEEDYLDDLNCKNCNLFMVCDGGCPLLRLKNKWHNADFDTCHISKNFIEDFIFTNIEIKNKAIDINKSENYSKE